MLLQAVPFINKTVQIREKNNVSDPLQTCYNKRCGLHTLCKCMHLLPMCACIKYSTPWKDRAPMEALSPEQQCFISKVLLKSCQAREARTVVEPSLGARVVSSHSEVFHLCHWTEGASPAQRVGEKRIPLAQGQFLRVWQLDSLLGTSQLLGCHQCGPGKRELPKNFIDNLLIPLGTEIWKPYFSSRAKLKEKWSCLKGVDISGDLAIIAGPVVPTSQCLEFQCAPTAS